MLLFEEAIETVLDAARSIGSERVEIGSVVGRVLAEDVASDIDMPPFDKSAMDGFACRRVDLGNELAIVETIPAGYVPTVDLGVNECAKIMTGSMVPRGADCVVMKEYVETAAESTIRFAGDKTADNICRKGTDGQKGEIVVGKGTVLRPHHVAVLASVGKAQPLVAKRPNVGIFSTGSELIDPASAPRPSQIRDSNSFQLAAQIESTGAVATNYGIAADTHEAIDGLLKRAVDENDIVIVSGGVSVGDFDVVPEILRRNSIELMFEKIAVKPGKPAVFGVSEKGYCFGLPGNPVAAFVLFELMVKPLVYGLMGHEYAPVPIQMPLGESIKRSKTERLSWIPVRISGAGTLIPVEYHGSAHINALCGADGLISIEVGVAEIAEGTIVPVRLI